MTSPKVTLPKEEEGVDVNGVEWDGAEREEGAANSCCNLNCAPLRFMVATSMAQK